MARTVVIAREERWTPRNAARIFSGKLEELAKESCGSEGKLGSKAWKATPVAVTVPAMK